MPYLRQDVQLDPLINHWYAWPGLIAPSTAPLHIAGSHLKIMQSYVAAPQVHAAAVKNPKLRGGPFIDVRGRPIAEAVAALEALIAEIQSERSGMLAFARAVKELHALLEQNARGGTLEPLYERIPEPLNGYVELAYDVSHQPSVRFLEKLLYLSPQFDRGMQSIALSLDRGAERPFVFSNPFVDDDSRIHASLEFASGAIDTLFAARFAPRPRSDIRDILGVGPGRESLLDSMLTGDEPAPAPRWDKDEVRVRYFGHACVLMERRGVSILTDPVIAYAGSSGKAGSPAHYTYADLPERIDYVVITHGHSDHLLLETLLQLRSRIGHVVVPRSSGGYLADPSLALMLRNIGFKGVIELDELEVVELDGGAITGLPFLGEHADLGVRAKLGYHIRLGERAVMCLADSSNLSPVLYRRLRAHLGPIDVLFLGMECDGAPLSWIYGPLLMRPIDRKADQERTLSGSDFERAIRIVEAIDSGQVYIYAMGQEPWLGYITSIAYTERSKPIVESNKLLDACRERGVACERLYCKKEIVLS